MHKTRNTIQSGYTLVELSIVIIIVGLLTASGLAVGASMVERAAYIDTQKLITQLQQTLRDFYIVNGRLPCVAPLDDLPGTDGFGEEIPNCSTGGANVGETFTVSSTGDDVRIGMVPVRTLGLPDSAAQDKYGNRIFYAVGERYTHKNSFGDAIGGVRVVDASNAEILPNAVYFLASPGRDRKGAYAYQTGQLDVDCDAVPANLDVFNCDTSTSNFRDAPFNNGDVPNRYFDDLTAWAPAFHFMSYDTQSGSLWATRPLNPEDIYAAGTDGNAATGNVGIGTQNPTNRLTVTGNANITGNTGLGTDSPTDRLSVVGNVGVQGAYTATGTDSVGISYRRTDNRDARIMIGDSTARWSIASGWGTAGEFSLIQEGISGNRIYVDSGGRVGLSTSNPIDRLHVNGGGVYTTGNLRANNASPTLYLQDTNNRTAMIHVNSDLLYVLRGGNNGTSWDSLRPLVINLNNGNVGIGTTSPNDALDVKGGKIRGQLNCAQYDSGGSWDRAVASCPANRWLMSGGGWCANLTQDAMILNRPNGNSWQAECFRHDGPWDAVAYARAVCCLD